MLETLRSRLGFSFPFLFLISSALIVESRRATAAPLDPPERPSAQDSGQTRKTSDPTALRHWLENMVWHHRYQQDEILQVTGLRTSELDAALERFDITPGNAPLAEVDPPIFVLPYPGGRHPRAGFLDGAIEPQRETKLSVFAPWDRSSYLVLDAPEAIWSNLGLTYLAHTHIDTIWSRQGIQLERLEWESLPDGSYHHERTLPNGIRFSVMATPHRDHLAIRMSLFNGTAETLTDLRVQMCAMLRSLRGFDEPTNDNKLFKNHWAACRDRTGNRWVILGFQPNHRAWGNPPCPCLHSDPRIPDCPPGETRHVDGWLSFYQGPTIDDELARIDTIWNPTAERTITGEVVDASTGQPMACRIYVQDESGRGYFATPATPDGQSIRYEKRNWVNAKSEEFHTSLSAHPFHLRLKPGKYAVTVECGKEYLPWRQDLVVDENTKPLRLALRRWIHMAEKGWYSGDAHVHRPIRQLAIPMLADDVNVALPMVYWTTRDTLTALKGDRTDRDDRDLPAQVVMIDKTHAIWPKNTEWEIFSVGGSNHTLGALFAINHRTPFDTAIPPVRSVIEQTDREGALLDLDKVDWPFAMVLPPMLGKRLTFELANNHMWRTEFAFEKWSTPAPQWMRESQPTSDTASPERDWIEYTHHVYWTLLNCGYRLQPTAGTATGVHPVPIGFGRVYVHVPGEFDYSKWIDGLRNGHSFVTTGPMLLVHREGNRIEVETHADGPLASVEWIVNGQIEQVPIDGLQRHADGSTSLRFTREFKGTSSSWIAVRVWQQPTPGRWRFAHSAPQWFEIPDRPIRPNEREQAFLIHRMEEELQRSRSLLPAEAVEEYRKAIEHYQSLR